MRLSLIPSALLAPLLCAVGQAAPDSAKSPNAPVAANAPASFIHPGLLHTNGDLQRIQARLAEKAEPWVAGFEKLRADPHSTSDWTMRGPHSDVNRDEPTCHDYDEDGTAAYQNALMWCLTGTKMHAFTAIGILNRWSYNLKAFSGRDKILGASLGTFKYINAAELLRYSKSGWLPTEIRHFEQMLRAAVYPVIKDYAPTANGNWDGGCEKTILAMGVFCDDRTLYQNAVDYFLNGRGNGRLTHYIINDAGQCQESGRDQQHAQLGLGHLAETCEIAWNQGLDLYGQANNRLLHGFEYTAQFNLGQDVPFVAALDLSGHFEASQISYDRRGELRPIYEMVWNHYQNRRHIPAPFTSKAAAIVRPEGTWHGDHPGFGTLLFSLSPTPREQKP